MPAPLLIDLSHTAHTRARTGVQRVVRSLYTALGGSALAITHDPYADTWRKLAAWEEANLAAEKPAAKRGARWPLGARLRSRGSRLFRRHPPHLPGNSGVLVPEIFSPAVARALPALFAATQGPRAAIFHDAIALKLPELTPASTVARFPAYLVELLSFDGIAAVSEDSRDALLDYWRWLGAPNPPPVHAIPLGIESRCHPMDDNVGLSQRGGEPSRAGMVPAARTTAGTQTVLSVGSIEGRKNHSALLDGCEQLWGRGIRFNLHLIGLAHPQTGAAALARIRALQSAGRPLRYDGPVTDGALDRAYAACAFTVYPSLMEGFGLPVLESLVRGKPCICSARGALGESACGGGCVALEVLDASTLASAIERLLADASRLDQLRFAASRRTFKPWPRYAEEFIGWMSTLRRRSCAEIPIRRPR